MHCPVIYIYSVSIDKEIYSSQASIWRIFQIDTVLLALAVDQATACSLPLCALTLNKTGTGTASMISRNTKPLRMFPVVSLMRPTMAGPTNEADLSVRAKREKNDDS
jgi:hypothetical protein